ncbi:MAG: hypothetical protein AB9873_13050 [Syntrophobacteraceae bacterium]
MEESELIKRYAYYLDWLRKLGSIPLSRVPTLDDVQPSRGVVQAGYKQMKDDGFSGSLLDYLCWVSASFIGYLAKKSGQGIAEFVASNIGAYEEDCTNLLRLVMKNPKGIVTNREDFIKLAVLWYTLITNESE